MNYWRRVAITSASSIVGGLFFGGPMSGMVIAAFVNVLLTDNDKKSIDDLENESELLCMISCVAKLANIDGKISRKEIKMIEDILQEGFNLDKNSLEHFLEVFDSVAEDKADFQFYIEQYGKITDYDYNKSINLISLLLGLAHIDDDYCSAEENAIKEAIGTLHLPSNTYEQILFQYKFDQLLKTIKIREYGTGVFINDLGYIVTNYHVIINCKRIKVRTQLGFFDANIISIDEKNDLCLLKIDLISVGILLLSDNVKIGQEVVTYGFPQPDKQGFAPKMTQGIISSMSGCQDDPRFFQIDAAIQSGNSGGPLIDKNRGSLIGIVSKKMIKSQDVNYAIKNEVLDHFISRTPGMKKTLHYDKGKKIDLNAASERLVQSTVQILACK